MALRGCLLCFLALAAVFGAPASARAQTLDLETLAGRLDRLQRELTTLQQAVFQGGAPGTAARPATAAATVGSRRVIAGMEVRLAQIEDALRSVTGKAEELEYAIAQFNARLEKLTLDADARLRALEAGSAPVAAGAPPAPGVPGVPGAPAAPGTPGAPDAPPRPLGSLPAPGPGAPPGPAAPERTPKEQYEHATALLLDRQDANAAEAALRSFIAAHPKDALADNAHYWLGETFYLRRDYRQAAFAFADAFRKYPNGRKAPDSLYKLGLSLARLDKKKEACTAFRRLVDTFPKLPAHLVGRVQQGRRQLGCR